MSKITFKKTKPYSGVNYSVIKKDNYDSYWKLKHQVPILSELPNESIDWSSLRFPFELRKIPNDSGDYYDSINFQPIKKGDVIYNFGDYIGVVSETKVSGDDENGYYIEIIYDKIFKSINNQRVLVNEIRIDKLDISSFLFFFWYGLDVTKLSYVKYVESEGIVPHYQNIINEQNQLINQLKSEIYEYRKILGNLDKRIEDKAYQVVNKYKPSNPLEDYPLLKSKWDREEQSMRIRVDEQHRKDREDSERRERGEFRSSMEKIGSDGRNQWQFLYGLDRWDREI